MNLMNSKIIVTGGAGAVGFPLCKRLAELGAHVYLVDNYSRSERDTYIEDLLLLNNVEEINADLSNPKEVALLPDDVEYIFHLAAYNGTQNFYEIPFDVLKHSTLPTINLLDHYSKSKSLKRFVYTGSSEAYASTVTNFGWEVPTSEDVPLGIEDAKNVRWSYGGSKLHGELALFAANEQFDMPVSVLRYHNVFGPRMGYKHVIPDFLDRVKNGIYELYGYEDTRSFIYVDDAVNATISCATTGSAEGEIINIGGEQEITMLQLGETILKILDIKADIKCYPSPKGSVKRRAPDITKLKKLTGFEYEVDIATGLKLTADYYL